MRVGQRTAWVLLLALVFACGDAGIDDLGGGTGGVGGTIDPGPGGSGGDAGAGGEGGAGGNILLEDECWTDLDCEPANDVCIPSEFDGNGIPGEVTDTPGVCELPPRQKLLSILNWYPGRLTDNDEFVVEPGIFDITQHYVQFREVNGPSVWEDAEMPYPGGLGPMGFLFSYAVEIHLQVVAVNDPDYTIECDLVFHYIGGEVTGGVVLEPGQVLCSNNTQDPGDPGLLIEYELPPIFCETDAKCAITVYEPVCNAGVCES